MSDLRLGDCLDVLKTFDDNSIDSIVTDPPYGLSFMGKKWDYAVPSVAIWAECLRVLKPGGHLLAFAGTRTQHRMAVNIEDAGFEIRDMMGWVYGSGFPKSHDVSKSIDKCNGETGRLFKFTEWMRTTGLTARQVDKITGTNMGGHYLTAASQPAIPTPALWALLRPHCGDVPEWVDQLVQRIEAEREVVGETKKGAQTESTGRYGAWGDGITPTAHATPEAQRWDGWGSALKPAIEPITVARKPFNGTLAANVLRWGTGGINVDACRVGTDEITTNGKGKQDGNTPIVPQSPDFVGETHQGRWPANLIHDGSDEVRALFPETNGVVGARREGGDKSIFSGGGHAQQEKQRIVGGTKDSGSAARFFYAAPPDSDELPIDSADPIFYCAKASKRDRDEGCEDLELKRTAKLGGSDNDRPDLDPVSEWFRTTPSRNHHPTVKPTSLMRYLCRLVTPPNGVILDPFCGSGSTGKGAIQEGFRFIGIDLGEEYLDIARRRIAFAMSQVGIDAETAEPLPPSAEPQPQLSISF